MLDRILIGIALTLGIVILVRVEFFKDKVAYVDSPQLLNGYKGMHDARAIFQKKASAWKANIDTLSSQVQQQIIRYEKESSRMTSKERRLYEELIRTKQKELANYQQAINAQAQQEDDKMTSEVLVVVNAYLKKYGEDNGYRLIFGASENGSIVFADEALDLTEDVLDGLNREYAGS